MILENREVFSAPEAYRLQKSFNRRVRLRWGLATALMVPLLLLAACQQPLPPARPLPTETAIPVPPVTLPPEKETLTKQAKAVSGILQKILQPEIYRSLTDKRLPLLAGPLSPHIQMTPEDCQSLSQHLTVDGVNFDFQRPPASIVYGKHASFDVSIATLKENLSPRVAACKVELDPESTEQVFEKQFYPGLAFSVVRRPDGFGEIGSEPGTIKPTEGDNTYRIIVKPSTGLRFTVWKNNTTLPSNW